MDPGPKTWLKVLNFPYDCNFYKHETSTISLFESSVSLKLAVLVSFPTIIFFTLQSKFSVNHSFTSQILQASILAPPLDALKAQEVAICTPSNAKTVCRMKRK